MRKAKPVIAVVSLSLTGTGLSGGDARLRAILTRWEKQARLVLITNPAAQDNFRSWGLDTEYVLSAGFPERLRLWNEHTSWIANMWFAFSVRSRLSRVPEPDVIYVQTDFYFETVTGIRLKRLYPRSKLVVLSHHSYDEIYDMTHTTGHLVMRWLQRKCFRMLAGPVDTVMVYPTDTGDTGLGALKAQGVDESRIQRMWNGIDLADIDATAAQAPAKDFDACTIGLRANKGLEDIVEIWGRVRERRPDARLYVLGRISRQNLQRLEREIADRNLEDAIVFGGHFDVPELYDQIRRARICVAPTHQEPYGIAICEAMACGLPVVGYDLANYRRLHEDILTTVPCFDRGKFARAVVELLSDDGLVTNLSQAALSHIRKFDNDRIAERDWSILIAP